MARRWSRRTGVEAPKLGLWVSAWGWESKGVRQGSVT
jgi:hypothetical protein